MNAVLAQWNQADPTAATEAMLACCAARRWADAMVALRPYSSVEALSLAADDIWSTMEEPDWLEAFSAHPRIGDRKASSSTVAAAWSQQEQSYLAGGAPEVLNALTVANKLYEERFGFTYIVCATGKNAEQMLFILEHRLTNDRQTELLEAAEQQRQIMQIRLGKWLIE